MKINRGDVFIASLNPRHGTEPGKLRPVVVIQSDPFNHGGQPSTTICPCTTQVTAPGNELRVRMPPGITKKVCDIMVDQSRTIDNRRIMKPLGHVPEAALQDLDAKLRNFLGL